MIRVLVVDDHPAVLAGLLAILNREVGIAPSGTARNAQEALDEALRLRPDLVLTDFQLLDGDGLSLCRMLKALSDPPCVLLYSACADEKLTVAALVAGAEGVVGKARPVDDLLEAIRQAARGELVLPQVPQSVLASASRGLDPTDMPIFGMRVARTPVPEIAETLGLDPDEVEWRIDLMLAGFRRDLHGTDGASPQPLDYGSRGIAEAG
jgi:DNA-binding NarL/FixJ family response regulator